MACNETNKRRNIRRNEHENYPKKNEMKENVKMDNLFV